MKIIPVNKDLKKSKNPEKTLYIFDNLNEAIDTVQSIINGIEDPDNHIYLIKNLKVEDDIGLNAYDLSDNERQIRFVYSPDGLPNRYRMPENKDMKNENVSIIGNIGDIQEPDLECTMKGIKITKKPESVKE